MRLPPLAPLVCTLGLIASAAVHAGPPESKGRPDKATRQERTVSNDREDRDGSPALRALVSVSISASEARRHAEALNLVGYTSLPPGIRRNLARGKPLPPGLAKRMAPQPLVARLPRYDGYEWQVAGADLVLVSIASAMIADVLTDVFR